MDRSRVTLTLSKTFLAELDRIALAERRRRTDVLKLLIRMGTRFYGRRRSLLCDGPRCIKRCCSGPREALTGNLREFPITNEGEGT